MNLMMLLQMAADGFGDRVAVGKNSEGMTYAQLYEKAGCAARQIRESKAKSVGFVDISGPNLPVALFGSAWAGRPFVPLNYRLTDEELVEMANEISPAYMICGDDYYSKLKSCKTASLVKPSEIAEPKSLDADWETDPEKEAILLFTSGTTGKPKAAILRHKHIVSYVLGSVEFMGASEDEASLISVPPYHIAGMSAIATSVYSGRRMVQLPNFNSADWIETARSENITHAMVVPTMLWRVVEELYSKSETIPNIRAISYGGGKMPLDVIEKALEVLPNTNFVNAYGMTETSSTISILGPEDHRTAFASKDPKVRLRLTSVGKPLGSMEVTIRDEEGKELGAGERGEIWVRGEQVSGEYMGRSSKVTPEGWFPTNDGGWIDDEGFLFVEGRLDDVIIKGGENISPGEIEDVVREHESVYDVAAVGTSDTDWGEAITLVVVLNPSAKEDETVIKEFVRDKLRSSRVPDRVEFKKELPYNETGKLLRRRLKAELEA